MKKAKPKKTWTCGACSACCASLNIDTPELKKPADTPCTNLKAEGGCSIYLTRPGVCRSWQCAWLTFELKHRLRPEKSSVLIRYDTSPLRFTLQPIGSPVQHLTTTDVLEFIAACVSKNTEVAISVPTTPGYQSARSVLNGTITEAELASEEALRMKVIMAIQHATKQKTDAVNEFIAIEPR